MFARGIRNQMSKRFWGWIIFVATSFIICCGSDLNEPITYGDACRNIEGAIKEKCETVESFNCEQLISCGGETANVEKIDVQECVTNIMNSKNCAAATKIYCAIACEE
ncbi:MAG: hypothetical protein Kow0090_07140 [Myxococcota bacterium]